MATIKSEQDEMDKAPTLIVVDGTPEETARIAGTGIECFAVYRTSRELDGQWDALRQAFHWLSEGQLRAALDYAAAHPEAMARRLAADEAVEQQLADLWRRYPQTKPQRR
jgi:uncharacterized protein (DUF433 family)